MAPGTDRDGAVRLADRVLEARAGSPGDRACRRPRSSALRAGFYAPRRTEPVNPEDLLFKATMALRRAQVDDGGFPVRAYGA